MANPTLDLITEYNSKALETLTALNELNVAAVDTFVNKQVELSNTLLDAGLAGSKELAAVKTPAEAVEVSNKLAQSFAATLTGFVKDSTAESVKTRDSLKAVIEDSVAMNSEYAGKAMNAGVTSVEKVKKTAAKKAS
jgi:hypothetical protein